MNNKNFALGKENFIIMAIALVIIIIGFSLMTGSATAEGGGFNPDIFSARRIIVAPIVALTGFVTVVFGILKKSKD